MNREHVIAEYINTILDGMDMDDLVSFAHDVMTDRLSAYTDAELREEVAQYYPELLEEEPEHEGLDNMDLWGNTPMT